ncbi:MAG: rRNA pseudouridine synthase [Planctomycetaceae bacterium]|nr:rRNA pseudouridine synthase [Planctomycetaceae bacterium]MBT6486368.1 rRNA pseudouridine synthase [Planctomycetaceae bacterium]MBT6493509.1 rRNA pseudouridine synthase [Planctomycetaceae bacterium]
MTTRASGRNPSSNHTAETASAPVRLQKFLASAGAASRRKCEELILEGRVTVDGKVCSELGITVDSKSQIIRLDGERVKPEAKRIYVLNKPPGYVCTNNDPTGRPLAVNLIPDDQRRLFSVGRLDEASEGLLLITNDGDLANKLAHPRYSVTRRYQVQVVGNPTQETLKQLTKGLRFGDGFFRAKGVKKIRSQGKSTYIEIELTEGHNRELRRLLARVGHKVIHLKRVTFGPVKLGRLGIGKSRQLRPPELNALNELVAAPGEKPPSRRRQSRKRLTTEDTRGNSQVSRGRRNATGKSSTRKGSVAKASTTRKSTAKKTTARKTTVKKTTVKKSKGRKQRG